MDVQKFKKKEEFVEEKEERVKGVKHNREGALYQNEMNWKKLEYW